MFSILFIFIRKSKQWTREHDILLCREVLALEVYKHTKGTNEAGRLWDEIAKNLRGCQTVRFKSNLSQRAVRERFNLIQGRFKENEKTELAASGISVPEQEKEKEMLLQKLVKRRVRRRLQQKISETKLWRGKEIQEKQ